MTGERVNDRPADIPGATGYEHVHKLTAPPARTANAPAARSLMICFCRMFKRQTTGSVVCASCGSLVGVNDDTCYSCGRRNPGLWGFGPMLRAFGNDLGFVRSSSTAARRSTSSAWSLTVLARRQHHGIAAIR